MQKLRMEKIIVAILVVGALANFGAISKAKGRTFAIPPPTPLPLEFHGWKGTLLSESKGTQAILPHAQITMVRYDKTGIMPIFVAIIASRDPNDMHTPERCLTGSGFTIQNVERRDIKVDGQKGGSWLFNRLLATIDSEERLMIYGYDGVKMLGSSTVMARIAMKLSGPTEKPAYFIRLDSPTSKDTKGTEERVMAFATDLMRERATWQE